MDSLKRLLLGATVGSLVSVVGLSALRGHEGIRYTAYPDPGTHGAPWTICRGHTGPEVHPGLTVSPAQCEEWFLQDAKAAETSVQRLVRVPLKQGEYDSYTSFVFNVGPQQFSQSTMLRLLNNGQHTAACNQFPRWKYANKMVLSGLVIRRTEEQRQCHLPGRVVYVPVQ